MSDQVGRRHFIGKVPGLARRGRALAVRVVLSTPSATAPLMASWSPVRWQLVERTDMVSPKSAATTLG